MTTPVEAISTPLLIGGAERPGGAGTFPVYDPAHSGSIIGHAAAASADDALAAVAAAEAAWPAWSALSAAERVGIVLKALAGLEADIDARTDILSRENGKVRFEAFIDLAVFAGRFHQAAQYAPELDADERIEGPPFNTTSTRLSRGVVTIIYPFNCSSVWSSDTAHAMRLARQLRTGVTFFNNHNATAVDERAPFGGFAQSGIGRELGREGMRDFTETHVMAVPAE